MRKYSSLQAAIKMCWMLVVY